MSEWFMPTHAIERLGVMEQVKGLHYVANGPPQVFIGELCEIMDHQQQLIMTAEVTGFKEGKVYLMPHGHQPVHMGYPIRGTGKPLDVPVGDVLTGRMVNAFCQPIDKLGPIKFTQQLACMPNPINPLDRLPISEQLATGINALDSLMPLGQGQRIGLFAGSGVGKSTLLGLMAGSIQSDINVIAFIGERGREVNDFIQQHLTDTLRQKTVIVAACSDEPPLIRRQAIYTATTIAEYFCQKGLHVALFIDSITRFAMAQREISLSLGESPTARGYTPSCFARLPGIVERAGRFLDKGSITGIYTILVEGDDFNEPIADNMRALLDGHVVLSRALAQQGCYPAISITESISRLQKQLLTPEQLNIAQKIFSIFSLVHQNRELIDLGAWHKGHNPRLDEALECIEPLKNIVYQGTQTPLTLDELWATLSEIVS